MSDTDAAHTVDTTQGGELEVLRGLLERLPVGDRDPWIVEFGAWDGVHLSNAYPLLEQGDWSGVLIEGDPDKYQDLLANWGDNPRVVTRCAMVGWAPEDGLDALLADTGVPRDFDVLSIDIDGNDYHVWEAVTEYRPKVVLIEFNQTMPNAVDFVQPADPNVTQGSSLRAMVRLATTKGYQLAACTLFNAFFVADELFPLLRLEDNSIDVMYEDRATYLFSGYDGQVFISGPAELPWHGLSLRPEQLQVLPRYFRHFPSSYSRPQLAAFYAFTAMETVRGAPTVRDGFRMLHDRVRRRARRPKS